MRRKGWKWAILGGACTIIILFGIDISTAGIERIHGPLTEERAVIQKKYESTAQSETERKIEALEKELAEIKKIADLEQQLAEYREKPEHPRLIGMPYESEAPVVHKLADSTADVLQSVSSGGIRMIASWFEGFIK